MILGHFKTRLYQDKKTFSRVLKVTSRTLDHRFYYWNASDLLLCSWDKMGLFCYVSFFKRVKGTLVYSSQ